MVEIGPCECFCSGSEGFLAGVGPSFEGLHSGVVGVHCAVRCGGECESAGWWGVGSVKRGLMKGQLEEVEDALND